MKSRTRGILSAAVIGSLIVACSAPSDTSTSSDGPAEGPDGSVSADDPAPAGEEQTLIIGGGDIDHIDMAQFHSVSARLIMANTYSPVYQEVMEPSPDDPSWMQGTGRYSYAITDGLELSEDKLTGTLRIHDGAKFATGEPVLAEDVEYTLERVFSGPGYTNNLADYAGLGEDVPDSIEAIDDTTVVIHYARAAAMAEKVLAFTQTGIIDKSVATDPANAGEDGWASDYLAKNATTSGPYEIESWAPGQSMELVRSDHTVFGQEAEMDRVTLRVIPDQAQRLLALKGGEIDLAMDLSPELIAEAAQDPALKVHQLPSSAITFMSMNNQMAPLDNPAVRQAISYAVPYDALLDSVMLGYGKPAGGPIPEPIEGSLGTEKAYRTDVEKAKSLLADAGLSDVNLTLTVNAENSQHVQAATFIQDALSKAGISVDVQSLPGADYTTKLNAKELQMSINSWYSYGEDPFYQMQFTLGTDAFTNYAQYSNPEVDKLLEEGNLSSDPDERAEIARQAQEIIIEEAPWAFLFTTDHIYVTTADISGVTNTQDKVLRLQYISRG